MDGERLAAFLSARCGKLTASNVARALSKTKKGEPTAGQLDLLRELVAERATDANIRRPVNTAMKHGLEFEDEAKDAYEIHTGNIILPCETIDHPTIEYFAATPDGMLGNEGLCEFKCPATTTFIDYKLAGVVPEEHKPQMLAQLACTRRKWVEFIAYDPRIKGDLSRRLFIRRFEPVAEEVEAIENEVREFLNRVQMVFQQYTETE